MHDLSAFCGNIAIQDDSHDFKLAYLTLARPECHYQALMGHGLAAQAWNFGADDSVYIRLLMRLFNL